MQTVLRRVSVWRSPVRRVSLSLRAMSSTPSDAGAGAGDPPKAVRKIKVYTRTGDKGASSLFNGTRCPKTDTTFAALGDTDELNAALGVARHYCGEAAGTAKVAAWLAEAQSRLLDAGSAIATPLSSSTPEQLERVRFDDEHVTKLENWIDEMDEELPPLRNFILPVCQSGGVAAVHLHVARTVCRRAERSTVGLIADDAAPPVVGRYLNRLSDFLFTAGRYAALVTGGPEEPYKKA